MTGRTTAVKGETERDAENKCQRKSTHSCQETLRRARGKANRHTIYEKTREKGRSDEKKGQVKRHAQAQGRAEKSKKEQAKKRPVRRLRNPCTVRVLEN